MVYLTRENIKFDEIGVICQFVENINSEYDIIVCDQLINNPIIEKYYSQVQISKKSQYKSEKTEERKA